MIRGRMTGCQAVSYALALIPAGLLPAIVGLAGPLYFAGALLLGLFYLSRPLDSGWKPATAAPAGCCVRRSSTCPRSCSCCCSIPCRIDEPRRAAASCPFCHAPRVVITMAVATHSSTATEPAAHGSRPAPVPRPPCPGHSRQGGDVALPGHRGHVLHRLIGSYIVLRAGSPHDGLQQPLSRRRRTLKGLDEHQGRRARIGRRRTRHEVEQVLHTDAGLDGRTRPRTIVHAVPHGARARASPAEKAEALDRQARRSAGAEAEVEPLEDCTMARALRRADQPPHHQPDGRSTRSS